MLLTELCLFTPIRFRTVHAQVSVNINYFYQGLQCTEWLAKRVYCKRQMKMRESKVTWMLNFFLIIENLGSSFTLSISSLWFCGPKTRTLGLAFLCPGVKRDFFRCSLWMARQVILKHCLFFPFLKKNFYQDCLLGWKVLKVPPKKYYNIYRDYSDDLILQGFPFFSFLRDCLGLPSEH